jgi:hypothetical protein
MEGSQFTFAPVGAVGVGRLRSPIRTIRQLRLRGRDFLAAIQFFR